MLYSSACNQRIEVIPAIVSIFRENYALSVNHEYFAVKIFLDNLAYVKIKHAKYIININDNAIQGRLSELLHKIFRIYDNMTISSRFHIDQ